MNRYNKALVWFRRDLRHIDNAALHHALASSATVYCVFIFDKDILDPLLSEGRLDRRVAFIHASLQELDAELKRGGGGLIVRHARAATEIVALADELAVDAVFANEDYEPSAVERDAKIAKALQRAGRALHLFKDQVIFAKDEVLSLANKPFSVFTPYKNAWLKKLSLPSGELNLDALAPLVCKPVKGQLAMLPTAPNMPTLASMGFDDCDLAALKIPTGMKGSATLLKDFIPRMSLYKASRDYPAVKGPSYLSVHLRFGTVSIRTLARLAAEALQSGEGGEGAAVWLSELIWRDFYFMILHNNPHVVGGAFKPEYDRIKWESGKEADQAFAAWCEGRTGYPLSLIHI